MRNGVAARQGVRILSTVLPKDRPTKLRCLVAGARVGYDAKMNDDATTQPSFPLRETDNEARQLARKLIGGVRHAALAVLDETGAPAVTRIAFGVESDGTMVSLISNLSAHAKRLKAQPRCGILIGDPPQKGNPLAFARLSLAAEVQFLSRDDPGHNARRDEWLKTHPKSALYVDFSDFNFIAFTPLHGDLNGGFGKAYHLTRADLI
jgi:putative heme iron utilization protein